MSNAPLPWLAKLLAPLGSGDRDRLRAKVAGKVILVTGASQGIGAALALRLGEAGAHVVLAARNAERLHAVAGQIAAAGGTARVVELDLADARQVAAVAPELAFLGIDVVVHNAGKSIRRPLLESLQRSHDFERTMAVNYLGPVQLQLALLPAMVARGAGHIVNVSSLGVRLPAAPRWAAYLASKGAFDTWLRSAAPELALHGIACTSVYLGLVHTAMSAPSALYRNMPGQQPDEAAQVLCRALIQRPRAIAPWWLWLCSWLLWPVAHPLEWLQSQIVARTGKRGTR